MPSFFRNINRIIDTFCKYLAQSLRLGIFSMKTTAAVLLFSMLIPHMSLASIFFAKNLKLGNTNSDVVALQQFLNGNPLTKVADAGPGSSGNETNYFGAKTTDALKRFQALYAGEVLLPAGLFAPSGFFGAFTRAKVNLLVAADESIAASQSTTTFVQESPSNPAYIPTAPSIDYVHISVPSNAPKSALFSVTVPNKISNAILDGDHRVLLGNTEPQIDDVNSFIEAQKRIGKLYGQTDEQLSAMEKNIMADKDNNGVNNFLKTLTNDQQQVLFRTLGLDEQLAFKQNNFRPAFLDAYWNSLSSNTNSFLKNNSLLADSGTRGDGTPNISSLNAPLLGSTGLVLTGILAGFALLLKGFGGKFTYAYFCPCSGTFILYIYGIKGGVYVYGPQYGTIPFSNYNLPEEEGVNVVGNFAPIPIGCWVPSGDICIPYYTWGYIALVGSSLAPL